MRRVADVSSVSGVSFDFCAALVFSLWFFTYLWKHWKHWRKTKGTYSYKEYKDIKMNRGCFTRKVDSSSIPKKTVFLNIDRWREVRSQGKCEG